MNWPPRSGFEREGECVWLPRFIDKIRKALAESAAPGDLLPDGYMLGEGDFLDAKLLDFLGLSSREVVEAVKAEPDDSRVAQALLKRVGKDSTECARWSLDFLQRYSLSLNMIDADERRPQPEAVAEFLREFYNSQIVRQATAAYVERRQAATRQ